MEKPSEWVSKLCRLYFADEYAKRTVGLPSRRHVPDIAGALRAVQTILPKLEVKMIEFLAEWMVFFSVQRLRGFRQVVTQAFTCRKLN